eukprot:9917962-Karenia_brevis.AAC.1
MYRVVRLLLDAATNLLRTFVVGSIVNDSGQTVATGSKEVASALFQHWLPTFSWQAIDPAVAKEIILNTSTQWSWN